MINKTSETEIDFESLQSKTISFLRPVLILFVVLIHTYPHSYLKGFNIETFELYHIVHTFFVKYFLPIRVPLFFFFSGFLFFRGLEQFSKERYLKKLKTRFKTLFIPYVFWNFCFLFFILITKLFPLQFLGLSKFVFSFSTIVHSLWNYYGYYDYCDCMHPINAPLWFVRDLMCMVLLSPVIYFLLKKAKIAFLALVYIAYTINLWQNIPGLDLRAITFFSTGAYFSIHGINFTKLFYGKAIKYMAVYAVLFFSCIYFKNDSFDSYLINLSIISGIPFIISLTSYFIEKGTIRPNKKLTDSTFFIFAYHAIVIGSVSKIFIRLFSPISEIKLILLFFLIPIFIFFLGYIVYHISKRILPRFTAFITGGR